MNYKKSYILLFNAITDAIEELSKSKFSSEQLRKSINILKKAQLNAEEIFLNEK